MRSFKYWSLSRVNVYEDLLFKFQNVIKIVCFFISVLTVLVLWKKKFILFHDTFKCENGSSINYSNTHLSLWNRM